MTQSAHEIREAAAAPASSSPLPAQVNIPIDSVPSKSTLSPNTTTSLSPSPGLTLSCHDLHYSVGGKEILKGISAVFRPGRVTGVMGSSGAGKTTLLSLLAGNVGSMGGGGSSNAAANLKSLVSRLRSGKRSPPQPSTTESEHSSCSSSKVTGEIKLNGIQCDLSTVGKVSGFVYQDDVILPTMTVEEALMMSAKLRLPEDMDEATRRQRCKEMLELLGIESCAQTPIGSATVKGISGGERKRAALAMEMIPNPAVLFLDEPTSGLDTVNAFNVVHHLHALAHSHLQRTIILTIHQPPSEVFHMLDDLLLLADGRVIYHGPTANAVPYFAALGYTCPLYTNPADFFFLQLLGHGSSSSNSGSGVEAEDDETASISSTLFIGPNQSQIPQQQQQQLHRPRKVTKSRVNELCNAWLASKEAEAVEKETSAEGIIPEGGFNLQHFRKESSTFIRQFAYLLLRTGRNVIRDKMMFPVKLLQTGVIGILFGLVYWQVGDPSKTVSAQSQDRAGCLYFLVVNQLMSSAMGVLSVFSKEKIVFLREHRLGYYRLPAYFLAKLAVELPYQVFFPILLLSIVYPMAGLRSGFGKFFNACIIAVLTALNGMAIGTLAATVFNSVEIALVILPLLLIPMMVFSGLMVNLQTVKAYFAWIPVISPTKYAYNAVMKNEFEGLVQVDDSGARLPGDLFLRERGMDGGLSVWENAIVLAAAYVCLLTFSYVALHFVAKRGK